MVTKCLLAEPVCPNENFYT